MPSIVFENNENKLNEANSPTGINTVVSGTQWFDFLDALGRSEASNEYDITNSSGFVGIYQFSSFSDSQSIFTTLNFSNTIGLMLNTSTDVDFLANPIAQELAAIMSFSGIPDFSASEQFASRYTSVRNAPQISQVEFDRMVGQTFTLTYVDSLGNPATYVDGMGNTQIFAPQTIEFSQAGISAAAHLVGQGVVAAAMKEIYDQAFDASGVLVNSNVELSSTGDFADGNGIAFSTYVDLFDRFDLSPLVNAPDGPRYTEFNTLSEELLTFRRDQILNNIETRNLEIAMSVDVGRSSSTSPSDAYKETIRSILTGLDLPVSEFNQIDGNVILTGGSNLIQTDDADLIIGIGNGPNTLSGGKGNDVIYGQDGNDILDGGIGEDVLVGGTGEDTYIINTGDGDDTIFDSGTSRLMRDGHLFTGVFRFDAATNKHVLDDNSGATIEINSPATIDFGNGDSVTFQDLTTIDLVNENLAGIRLIDVPTDSNSILTGTDIDNPLTEDDIIDFNTRGNPEGIYLDGLEDAVVEPYVDLAEDVTQSITDKNQEIIDIQIQINDLRDGDPLVNVDGLLAQIDSKQNEIIQLEEDFLQRYRRLLDQDGGNKPLLIEALAGDDKIYLSDADGFNSVIVDGGEGNDTISSGDLTRDQLRIFSIINTNSAYVLPETIMGEGHTFLGGNGSDLLLGGTRNDVLEGGDDDDVLQGRGGDDLVLGGDGRDFVSGSVGNDILTGDGGMDVLTGGQGNDILDGGDEADDLYGDAEFTAFFRTWTRTLDPETGIRRYEHLFQNFDGVDTTIGGDDRLFGGKGNDYLQGGAGDDALFGGDDNDVLQGDNGDNETEVSGNDELYGEGGSDGLFGGQGNDLLDGGLDGVEDLLKGGKGNDTYQYSFGYGLDIIDDEAGAADKIKLIGGVTQNDVALKEIGGDLQLILSKGGNPTGDILIASGWFKGNGLVETIEFSDGTIWNKSTIEEKTRISHDPSQSPTPIQTYFVGGVGTDVGTLRPGNDVFYSLGGNDLIAGGGGNDRLFGGTGDDELIGGDGDDALFGEEGNDHLSGQLGNDLLDGGDGDDFLLGNEGNDTLIGGKGNDVLRGGTGDDSYVFNRGDGDDVVLDDAGDDQLIFGAGITIDDISLSTQDNDLIINILDNNQLTDDNIIVFDWTQSATQIETLRFSDGSSLDVAAIQSRISDNITLLNGANAQGGEHVTTYTFTADENTPDGFNITINDAGGLDTLRFQENFAGVLSLKPVLDGTNRVGDNLILDITVDSTIPTIPNVSGQIQINNFYLEDNFIETIEFPDGVQNVINAAPIANDTAVDQIIDLDTTYNIQLSTCHRFIH